MRHAKLHRDVSIVSCITFCWCSNRPPGVSCSVRVKASLKLKSVEALFLSYYRKGRFVQAGRRRFRERRRGARLVRPGPSRSIHASLLRIYPQRERWTRGGDRSVRAQYEDYQIINTAGLQKAVAAIAARCRGRLIKNKRAP
ncbi:hypothetical protein EVAR_9239_1 [Eumeta japonica]|uniref:Uncharacterized protein n=1 Tax=Eumeta variegata TaxID=151549 RepID=A0A4C1TNR9_EUMVA|nr:hypothetical protein EVAR_9239_1 [Eumeta japonica]